MARGGFPSMTALLGLLAVAGYQNRDKLGQLLGGAQGGAGGGQGYGQGHGGQMGGQMGGQTGGMGGLPGGLGGLLGGLMGGGQSSGLGGQGGGGLGGLLGNGLNELQTQFRRNGRGAQMDSWVGTGPNQPIEPHDLQAAIDPDTLQDLEETTGLSRDELLRRLATALPQAVNDYTPQGRIPQPHEIG